MLIKLSETTAALRRIPFFAMDDDSADGYASKPGLSFSTTEVKLSKNGATEVDATGTVTEIGGGAYYYEATEAELGTIGFLTVRPAKTDVYTMPVTVQIVSINPYDANAMGMAYLDAATSSRLATTAYQDADDFLDAANGVETGMTMRQALRLCASVLGGLVSGASTGTEVFRAAVSNASARVTFTVDANGNRTSISYNL